MEVPVWLIVLLGGIFWMIVNWQIGLLINAKREKRQRDLERINGQFTTL